MTTRKTENSSSAAALAGELMLELSRLAVDLPDFANVYLEKLVWTLELPETETVLISPQGFSRLFEWRRDGLFWSRKPSDRLRDSLSELGFADTATAGHPGSRYPYSQFGSAARIELYTIDRDRFVSAITGNSTSAREIESVIHSRLAESTVAA